MVCELIGREQEPPRARQIALKIKQAIYKDVGETLRCSIGMAPNRYLAKIASDMQKPDGLIGLLPSQLPRAIAHLELRDLPGVGARTEVRLNAKGITTMEQLLALDRTGMHALWDSVWGDRLYHWLRGADTGDDGAPVDSGIQKSLGHSHVLGARTPHPRRRLGRRPQAPPQSRHAPPHGALLHRLHARHHPLPAHPRTGRASIAKAKKHFSGIRHSGWGMEARFSPCQDTLTLLERPPRRPGPSAPKAPSSRAPSSSASPCTT